MWIAKIDKLVRFMAGGSKNMKTIIRSTGMGFLLAGVFAVGGMTAYAQNPCEDYDGNATLDTTIRENYPNDATKPVAIKAAKEYIEKYGSCEAFKDFADWLKPQVPKWEERVKFNEAAEWLKPRFKKFDDGINASNWEQVYTVGGEIIAKYPAGQVDKVTGFDSIDQAVTLGLIGLTASYSNNMSFNDRALSNARTALNLLKGGVKSTKQNGNFGVLSFERSREDAISELTYTVGYINYWDKKDKKAGVANFYEVAQLPGSFKTQPAVYATIGEFYRDEILSLTKELAELSTKLNALTVEEEKVQLDAQIKEKEALFNGYAERAMDAYGRAYTLASDKTPEGKKYKEGLFSTISGLYELRFQKKDGINTWITTATAKPLPNPATDVEPIKDPEPAPTTSGATAVTKP